MTQINLLPWREIKREKAKKMFVGILLAGFVFAIAVVWLLHYCLSVQIDHQTERNQILKNEIIILDQRIATIAKLKQLRKALIARMEIIQELASTRPLTVHLFDELIKITPPGVVVTKTQREKQIVTVWGYAESNTNISELMRNIEKDEWIQNPELTEIKTAAEKKESMDNEFKLSFSMSHGNTTSKPAQKKP